MTLHFCFFFFLSLFLAPWRDAIIALQICFCKPVRGATRQCQRSVARNARRSAAARRRAAFSWERTGIGIGTGYEGGERKGCARLGWDATGCEREGSAGRKCVVATSGAQATRGRRAVGAARLLNRRRSGAGRRWLADECQAGEHDGGATTTAATAAATTAAARG